MKHNAKNNRKSPKKLLLQHLFLQGRRKNGTESTGLGKTPKIKFLLKYSSSRMRYLKGLDLIKKTFWFFFEKKNKWKNLPPPSEILRKEGEVIKSDYEGYNKANTYSDEISGKEKTAYVYAASCRGRSHANDGKYRDDSFQIKYLEETGWYILAVADGAGSAKFSRKGSEIACRVSVEKVAGVLRNDNSPINQNSEFLPDCRTIKIEDSPCAVQVAMFCQKYLYDTLAEAAFESKRAILKEVELMNEPTRKVTERDYNTTLLLAVCKKLEGNQWFVGSFGIGDGAIAVYGPGSVQIMNKPDSGEYAGETSFITMSKVWDTSKDQCNIIRRLHATVVPQSALTAILLMTDGVSDAIFKTDNNLKDFGCWNSFWKKLTQGGKEEKEDFPPENSVKFSGPNPKKQILKWLDFYVPGEHDDRTMIVLLPSQR